MAFDFIKTFHDIKALWNNNVRETINLEFKTELDSNSNEIAKDISAMSNAEGGIIIYGIKEDKNGAASHSSGGIEINKQDERIQQIVNSSIFPELQVKIEVISTQDNLGNVMPNRGFIIVRIPKSELQIHQVGTTARYYARNTTVTTPYRFEPIKLTERDIALRYEKRFENKKRIQDSLQSKRAEFLPQVGDYVFIASVPQAVSLAGKRIDRLFFTSVLFYKEEGNSISQNGLIYEKLSNYSMFSNNISKANGRRGYSNDKALKIEMNSDGTLYASYQKMGQIDLWYAVEMVLEFLHVLNRFYSRLEYCGGITVIFDYRTTFKTDDFGVPVFSQDAYATDAIPQVYNLKPTVKPVTIDKHLQFSSINFEQVFWDIFPDIFEQLGIDEPNQKFVPKVNAFGEKISKLKSR